MKMTTKQTLGGKQKVVSRKLKNLFKDRHWRYCLYQFCRQLFSIMQIIAVIGIFVTAASFKWYSYCILPTLLLIAISVILYIIIFVGERHF